jgi:hypothetical protein
MDRLPRPSRRRLAALLALPFLVAAPGIAAAADPDCATILADRAAPPLLRLACTLARITGLPVDGQPPSSEPPWPLYALVALAIGALAALALVALVALARHWARPRRPPDEGWWACAACRSFNEPTVGACYRCGEPRVEAGTKAGPEVRRGSRAEPGAGSSAEPPPG